MIEDHGGASYIPGLTATMHVYILDQEHAESAFAAGEFSNDVWGHLHPRHLDDEHQGTHQSHPLARLPRRMPYLHRHGAGPTDPAVRQRRLIHDQSLDRHRILGQPDHLDMKAPAADEAKAGTNE